MYYHTFISTSTPLGSSNLIRASTVLDDEVKEGGTETVLLENVEKFSLRYLMPGGDEPNWVDAWNSTEKDRADTTNKFPLAVEVTLAYKLPKVFKDQVDAKEIVYEKTLVAQIRFPNNVDTKDETKK